MRKPKKYVAKNGDVSWRVRYRSSEGTEKSETFYDEDQAIEFAQLIKALGVQRALDYIDRREKEEGVGPAGTTLTVDALFEKWFEWKSATRKDGTLLRVRNPRTLRDYRRMYEARIKERFGDRPANVVSSADVQEWIEDLNADLEPKTVLDYHGVLRGLYLWGLHPTRSLVIHDPCADSELLARRKKPPKGLRPDQWQILHAAAREVDPDAADLLLFMVSTSWRWSEAVPLIVGSVDHWIEENERGEFESFTYVTMGRVLRRVGSTFEVVEDAKSLAGEGRRARIKGAGEAMVLRRIQGKQLGDLVFTNSKGHRWVYSAFHQRIWTRPKPNGKTRDMAPQRPRILEVARRNGLIQTDVTPHWLRHTHVGMMILAGEPLAAISKRVGHSSTRVTGDIYGRMIEDISSGGLDKVAEMIGGEVSQRGAGAGSHALPGEAS